MVFVAHDGLKSTRFLSADIKSMHCDNHKLTKVKIYYEVLSSKDSDNFYTIILKLTFILIASC